MTIISALIPILKLFALVLEPIILKVTDLHQMIPAREQIYPPHQKSAVAVVVVAAAAVARNSQNNMVAAVGLVVAAVVGGTDATGLVELTLKLGNSLATYDP
jgi:hypothetical protein